MDQLGIRDLRNATADAVRRAQNGERIIITVDGRPTAQLGPLDPGTDSAVTLDDLIARGLALAPRRDDRPPPAMIVDLWAGSRIDRAAAEIRGDQPRRPGP